MQVKNRIRTEYLLCEQLPIFYTNLHYGGLKYDKILMKSWLLHQIRELTDITGVTFLTPFSQPPNIQEEPEVLLACSACMPKISIQRVSSHAPNQKQKQNQRNRDLYNLDADGPGKCQTRPFLPQLVNKRQLSISQFSRDWNLLEGRFVYYFTLLLTFTVVIFDILRNIV